ncbi:MAG: hypothetical protein KJT03_05345, partial [Verrucomicrobiae bacterium]|nr:hypothetical protein [Verrucomicrobiae bacterium]
IKWIVFNEAWGQHDTERILKWAEAKDPSRIISVASGWFDLPGAGDIRDIHDYSFYPAIPVLGSEPNRAVILGECGGFAGAVPPHNWTGRSNQVGPPENLLHGGFDPSVPRDDNRVHDIFRPTFTHGRAFEKQYSHFIDSLMLLKNNGLTAAIYTQMTDMKLEENGWLTFDREVSKMDVQALRRIHEKLYWDPPAQFGLINGDWNYHFGDAASDTWTQPGFDDASWETGSAPFGFNRGKETHTAWQGGPLLLRKSINLASIPRKLSIRVTSYLEGPSRNEWIYTKVYLNGQFVQDDQTRQFMPELRVADIPLWPETVALLKPGDNTLAIEVIPGFSGRSGKVENTRPMKALAFDFDLMAIAD